MAELSSHVADPLSTSAPVPSLRRYSAGLGIFLGGIPLFFGAPSAVGIGVAVSATLLGIAILPRLAAAWNAWADEAWFEAAATVLIVLGAAGWACRMFGWTPRPETFIGPIVSIAMQIKRRRSKKDPKPRPLMKDQGDGVDLS